MATDERGRDVTMVSNAALPHLDSRVRASPEHSHPPRQPICMLSVRHERERERESMDLESGITNRAGFHGSMRQIFTTWWNSWKVRTVSLIGLPIDLFFINDAMRSHGFKAKKSNSRKRYSDRTDRK